MEADLKNEEYKKIVDEIASLMLYMDEVEYKAYCYFNNGDEGCPAGHIDFETYEKAKKLYESCVEGCEKANWNHCGDCVNAPGSCIVCFVEMYRDRAIKHLNILKEEDLEFNIDEEVKQKGEILMKFDEKDAKLLGDILNVNWDTVCIKQFTMGLNVELEHGTKAGEYNVTNDDPIKTAKIALAHLAEKHNYYDLLKKVES